ncbi:hypothetical protein J6590_024664 [Homalodisca vitripennis]|nr:hypothetical protein J6590_024664 [Homalodisca vitripennis]
MVGRVDSIVNVEFAQVYLPLCRQKNATSSLPTFFGSLQKIMTPDSRSQADGVRFQTLAALRGRLGVHALPLSLTLGYLGIQVKGLGDSQLELPYLGCKDYSHPALSSGCTCRIETLQHKCDSTDQKRYDHIKNIRLSLSNSDPEVLDGVIISSPIGK